MIEANKILSQDMFSQLRKSTAMRKSAETLVPILDNYENLSQVACSLLRKTAV
jgi:hypothetical protein